MHLMLRVPLGATETSEPVKTGIVPSATVVLSAKVRLTPLNVARAVKDGRLLTVMLKYPVSASSKKTLSMLRKAL